MDNGEREREGEGEGEGDEDGDGDGDREREKEKQRLGAFQGGASVRAARSSRLRRFKVLGLHGLGLYGLGLLWEAQGPEFKRLSAFLVLTIS